MSSGRFYTAVLVAGLVLATPAWANHDDSTLVGLRVTVGSVNPTTGDVTITVTASDDASTGNTTSDILSNAYLGTVFAYDGSSYTLSNPKIPAIDWGDGATLGNAKVPFTTIVAGTHNGNEVARYKGQFAHTYGAPGVYTIKAFGINVYGEAGTPIYGNEVTAATWSANGGSFSETTPDGVSATAMVTLAAVPAMQRTGLALLALVLALTGAALLLLKRS